VNLKVLLCMPYGDVRGLNHVQMRVSGQLRFRAGFKGSSRCFPMFVGLTADSGNAVRTLTRQLNSEEM